MDQRIPRSRRWAAVPTAVVLGLVGTTLSGCSSAETSGADPSSAVSTASDGQAYVDADVEFVTGMIPHHAQAVAMVDLADGRDVSPEVRSLMTEIKAAQAPEIREMQGLLRDWDQPTVDVGDPTAMSGMEGMEGMEGMDHSGMDMGGMMTPEMFTELEQAPDRAFETMWLDMMIGHHKGAVQMARDEVDSGRNPDAVRLARTIVETQTEEIRQMRRLL